MVIDALDGVVESAVIGVPHPDFGEGIVAVVAKAAGSSVTADQIAAVLNAELAAFKRPKRIIIAGDLPRNAMGKVQKAELRSVYKTSFTGILEG
jgi:malonyl-CoA/methylmalonyl-CoA synthetase